MRKKAASARRRAPLRVGDVVRFHFVGSWEQGPIVEDRGRLGYKGERLLKLRLDLPYGADPIMMTMPESELRVVRRARRPSGRSRARAA